MRLDENLFKSYWEAGTVDIFLTAGICIVQTLLAYMGVHVALRPPDRRIHWRWIGGFVSVGLVGVALTAWLAKRSGDAQDSAAKQIAALQTDLSHVHMRTTIGSYSVDDQTKITRDWKPFSAGEQASFRVTFTNTSSVSESQQVGAFGHLVVTNTRPDVNAEYQKDEKEFKAGWKGEVLGPGDSRFVSARSGMLTEAQAGGIATGSYGVFLFSVVRFSDKTGNYEQEDCAWLQPKTLDVWHPCGPSSSGERKL